MKINNHSVPGNVVRETRTAAAGVIEDETLLKTRVEDTAYLFKSEDEE